jgi:hypothetical protein
VAGEMHGRLAASGRRGLLAGRPKSQATRMAADWRVYGLPFPARSGSLQQAAFRRVTVDARTPWFQSQLEQFVTRLA